ncbi:uncharacterized protein LOC114935388 isoform X2 [Nylanderia fulva]|uniref:uncharacterized protein LOC114935388 isoform X2 n=1 Tax=Nylanderia fulva TaxID=613905 RepID=UPI0010FB6BFA|nr:uncharacterized protein LOC114935388 isoform X2 [Nylanderia fulva]
MDREENEMSDERSKEVETIKQGRFRFAMKCLHKVMGANQNKSFVFSPACLYDALFLTFFLIKGEISERLKEMLCLGPINISKTDFINYYSYRRNRRQEWIPYSQNCNYDIRCWMDLNQKKFLPKLENTISYFFDNPMNNSKQYRNCKDQIRHVNELLNRLVEGLINERITLPDDEQDIILMTSISNKLNFTALQANQIIRYFYPPLDIHVTKLRSTLSNLSLLILAPASLTKISNNKIGWRITQNISHADLSNFTQRLSTMQGIRELRNVLKSYIPSRLLVDSMHALPFELEKDLTIRELFETLNIPLLTSEMIELDTLFGNNPRVQIRNAVHRSHIKATNEEVVVCATTLISSKGEDPPSNSNIVDINCNNPVIWMIGDREYEDILYVGSCNNTEPVIKLVSADMPSTSGCPPSKKRRIDESS